MIDSAARSLFRTCRRGPAAVLAAAAVVVLVWAPAATAQEATDNCPEKYTTVKIEKYTEDPCTVMNPIEIIAPGQTVKFINGTGQDVIIAFDDQESPFPNISFKVLKGGSLCQTALTAVQLGIPEGQEKEYLYTAKPRFASEACGQIGEARPRIVIRASVSEQSATE